MVWHDARGVTAVRQVAHADDAKNRSDETHFLLRRPRSRPLMAALAAAVLLVLVLAGVGAAKLASRSDEDPTAGREPTRSNPVPSDQVSSPIDEKTPAAASSSVVRGKVKDAVGATATMSFTLVCSDNACTVSDISPEIDSLQQAFARTFQRSGQGFTADDPPIRSCTDATSRGLSQLAWTTDTLTRTGQKVTLEARSPAYQFKSRGGGHVRSCGGPASSLSFAGNQG